MADVEALTDQDVLDLLGIEISPARLKCALLSLDTLHHAAPRTAPDCPGRPRRVGAGHDPRPGSATDAVAPT